VFLETLALLKERRKRRAQQKKLEKRKRRVAANKNKMIANGNKIRRLEELSKLEVDDIIWEGMTAHSLNVIKTRAAEAQEKEGKRSVSRNGVMGAAGVMLVHERARSLPIRMCFV